METNEKMFVVKCSKGTYYVQRMTDGVSGCDMFRLMRNRRVLFRSWQRQCDFTTLDEAILKLLRHLEFEYDAEATFRF